VRKNAPGLAGVQMNRLALLSVVKLTFLPPVLEVGTARSST
jgi:hypothetical protein